MPQLEALRLPDGTGFITHVDGADHFGFEVPGRHLESISVRSAAIESCRDLLAKPPYRRSPLDAGGTDVRRGAIHTLGIAYGNNHEHFDSARGAVYDGIAMLAYRVHKIGATSCCQIARMAIQ